MVSICFLNKNLSYSERVKNVLKCKQLLCFFNCNNVCCDTGWLAFCIGFNVLSFESALYDPVNGCASVDLSHPANYFIRLYTYFWIFFTYYPFPLFLAVTLNTVAVLWLRFESRLLTVTERAGIRSTSSQGSTLLKRRAAIRLQYASIALVVSFAVTSGPFQVLTAIQFISGL